MSIRIMQPVFNKFAIFALSVLTALSLSSCSSISGNTKSSLELQAIQSKVFETQKKTAFSATMSVFQDLGYTLGTADLETGFITAKSPTKEESMLLFFGQKMQNINATAFVTSLGAARTKIRITFVNNIKTSHMYGMKGEKDEPIEDPQIYQDAFTKIQKAIFVIDNVEN